MALTDLTRISTSGIATGSTIDAPILRKDVSFRGSQVGVTSALFDSSDDALEFNNNVKLKLGNSGNFSLYSDGVNGILHAQNDPLYLKGEAVYIQTNNNEASGYFLKNGAVKLYFNGGDPKFETTQTGAIVTGILTATGFSGPLSNASGISTFYDLRVTNNLTVEGTTTTLDTNLIGVDRVEVGANSNSIVGVAITQSGTADLVNLFDGATKVVAIDDTGKVGIGTDAPTQLIDVLKTSNNAKIKVRCTTAGAYFEADSASSGYVGLILSSSGTQRWLMGGYASNNFTIKDGGTGGTERFTIVDGTGNVGIGSAIPAQKLDVAGNIKVTGAIDANGDLDVDGHTNLDNVSIAGVSTFTGQARFNGELVGSTISVLSGYSINIPDKLIHSGDTDTAIRFPANDTFTIETAGSEALRITHQGRIGLNGVVPTSSHANVTSSIHLADSNTILSRTGNQYFALYQNLKQTSADVTRYLVDGYASAYAQHTGTHRFYTVGNGTGNTNATVTERLRITNDGKVLIGSGTITASIGGKLQLTNSNFAMNSFANNPHAQTFHFTKSRGTSGSGGTIVQDNDFCGHIEWYADDGVDTASQIAKISARINGTPGANDTPGELLFYTTADGANASTERLRIDSSGRITGKEPGTGHGMGGIIASTANASGNAGFGFMTAGTQRYNVTLIGTAGNEALRVYDNNNSTERLRINSTGKIGINESSPDALLHLKNISAAGIIAGIRFESSGTGNSAGDTIGQLEFEHNDANDAGVAATIKCTAEDELGNVYLTFNTGKPTSVGERLRITSDGRVSIGVNHSSVQSLLNVKGNNDDGNQTVLLRLGNDSSGSGTGAAIVMGAGAGASSQGATIAGFYDGTGTSLLFKTCDSFNGTPSQKFRVTNDGKILCGDGNYTGAGYPSVLQVQGTANLIDLNTTNNNPACIHFYEQGSGRFRIGVRQSDGFIIKDTLNNSPKISIAMNGDVKVDGGTAGGHRSSLDVRQATGRPAFNIGFADGSFYRNLGTAGPRASDGTSNSGNQYLHVRFRTVWNDYGMTMFRITGYISYTDYTESYVGMYRYGNSGYRTNPYGLITHNQKRNTVVAAYNTTADPGYLVIVCDWDTDYMGLMFEHIGAGGAYGEMMQQDLEIIDSKRSSGTSDPGSWS